MAWRSAFLGIPTNCEFVFSDANDNEALNFADEIFDKMFDLGYTNISKGDVSKSHNYFGSERITVKKDILPVPAIRFIINPQQ